jgi:MoaA/NifB/PqqE/SkfB family radical SAM enzyme
MANLSITNVCNKKCVYCFANDTKSEYGKSYLDIDTYKKALDYIERSGLRQARILGGEPTLHPDFIKMLDIALQRDLEIMLFTNGLMPKKVLDYLSKIPEEKLSILLNTIHPQENNLQGTKKQKEMMNKLGNVIIPGVNIYSATQDLDYLVDYVVQYKLRKEIRLGISHSVLSQNNVYLHPKEYHKIGYNISLLKLKAKEQGISLGFDCGFVPCMFPREHFELLSEELKKAGNCCHPIIDMLTDGSFISCYPLNNFLKIKIHDNLVAKDLIDTFDKALQLYKEVGIFQYCRTCALFNKRCNGGCMSFRIQRFTNN